MKKRKKKEKKDDKYITISTSIQKKSTHREEYEYHSSFIYLSDSMAINAPDFILCRKTPNSAKLAVSPISRANPTFSIFRE